MLPWVCGVPAPDEQVETREVVTASNVSMGARVDE